MKNENALPNVVLFLDATSISLFQFVAVSYWRVKRSISLCKVILSDPVIVLCNLRITFVQFPGRSQD